MRELTKPVLAALAVLLSLWLIWGFWPLGTGSRLVLSLVVLVLTTGWALRGWRLRQSPDIAVDMALPPENFSGTVILVCGASEALFSAGQYCRETRQGWYLPVHQPEHLSAVVDSMVSARPALLARISVLLAVLPEQWLDAEVFSGQLRQWQRALVQSRRYFSGFPPVWLGVWLNGPHTHQDTAAMWFVLSHHREGIEVQASGGVAQSYPGWCEQGAGDPHLQHFSGSLWLQSVFCWLKPQVLDVLSARHVDTPAISLSALVVCDGPVSVLPDNLWQQYVADLTTLVPCTEPVSGVLPLPDMLLTKQGRGKGISRLMQANRLAGMFLGCFLLLAMLASYLNNQRLILNIGDHLRLYHQLSGTPPEPKQQMQTHLRHDAALLDLWARDGAPLRYTLGLYQGMRLIPSLEAAINDWTPPPPPAPVIKNIIRTTGPQTVRLNSMSLFDVGKWQLKPGSTKVLINALVGIKAKPGWLIVVAGHTDNTGDDKSNQTLSLKRAESVRDWMRDTGDVPESCFAVQGYGESRPVATNDTPEGRAQNRRVEISLVPQADACQAPDTHQVATTGDINKK